MAATYSAIGHDLDHQHGHEADTSYDSFRNHEQVHEKHSRHVGFQLPSNVTVPLQELSSKIHGHNYRQIQRPSEGLWNPGWLSGLSFLLFAAWYMLLIFATAALYLFSSRNAGISGQTYAYRYSWTYGPTAVLALTLSLWSHVEYWCKELTPWARMRTGPTPSRNGILADYFTKWPHIVLWNAFRSKDHAVWLSALGSFLLHLGVIVSTSVIALEPSLVTEPSTFSIADAFVTSPPNISVAATSGNALVRYFGISARNLSYPVGTSANLTISNFAPSTIYPSNSTFVASVSGMSASLECEPLPQSNLTDVTSQPWKSILAPVFTTNISVNGCNINRVPIGMGVSHDPPVTNTVSAYQGWWNNYTCNDGLNNAGYPDFSDDKPVVEGANDHRLVFTTSFIQWTPRIAPNVTRKTWVQNFTGIICKPRYSIDYYDVELSPAKLHTKDPFQARLKAGTSIKIEGLADIDLAALVKRDSANSLIVKAALRQTTIAYVTDDRGYLRSEDPFFTVLSGDGDTSQLSNQTEMLLRIPEVFLGVAAQAVQEYLTIPGGREIQGTVQVYANRLKAKAVPVGLMLGFLSLLIIISLSLIFLSPWDSVPSNPQSIAAKAKYLAASPSLARDLRALNGLSMHQLHNRLRGSKYRTITSSTTREFVVAQEEEPLIPGAAVVDRSGVSEAATVWWKPVNHRFWFIFLITFSPLAIIAVLQVLQHISDTRDGIKDVTDLGSRRILLTLIPAAILSIVAVSIQTLHFNACLTAPFNALKHGGAPHSRGLTVSLLGKTSPHVLVIGIKHHLFIPCVTAFCVMIGAFLTIVVSGLYFVQDVPLFQQVTLQRSDVFNFTGQDLSLSDNLAGVTTKLQLKENLASTQFTYNDLVFPAVTVGDVPFTTNGSSLEVMLPAIRPRLRCFPNDANSLSYDRVITYSSGIDNTAEYLTNFSVPCPGNSSICHASWGFRQLVPQKSSNFTLGRALDVTSDDCLGTQNGTDYVLQQGCPALTFAVGSTSFTPLNGTRSRQTKPQIRAFMCFGYLEEVQTTVTMLLPEYTISNATDQTPVTKEDTARNLTFSSSSYTGSAYTNALSTLINAIEGTSVQIDPITDYAINVDDNSTTSDLLDDMGAAKLQSRVSTLYTTYMVNAISSNFRIKPADFNTADLSQSQPADMLPGTTYSGSLSYTHRQRLKQDQKTTIALQVMLAVVTVLALSVFFLTDRKLRLPANPSSIAGTMVLLAGSEMSSRNVVPYGSEWHSETRIWEGWLFSLGWWSDGKGKRFGIDIGNAVTGVTGAIGSLGSHQHQDHIDHPSPPQPGLTHFRDRSDHYPGLIPEEHELEDINKAPLTSVGIPSGVLGWNRHADDSNVTNNTSYAGYQNVNPVQHTDTSYNTPNQVASQGSQHQQQQQQQQQWDLSASAGDMGTAQSTSRDNPELERLSEKFRSRVARQYQPPQ